MSIRQFVVDAFSQRSFAGNPAAVCILDRWPQDSLLQNIAAENNLCETAFIVSTARGFRLRLFTPVVEVDLCGHATLATAHVLFRHMGFDGQSILFETQSGDLIVRREGERLQLDFPARAPVPGSAPVKLLHALKTPVQAFLEDGMYLAVVTSEAELRALQPDLVLLRQLDRSALIVTAPGDDVDFVSRFFAPKDGIDEDPVTGSAHCVLTPYWASRLGRDRLRARQISARGGQPGCELDCELRGSRVLISGYATTFSEGVLHIDATSWQPRS